MATATVILTERPYYMQAADGDPEIPYSAQDFRNLVTAIWPRSGRMYPGGFLVAQSGTVGMAVSVAPGRANVSGYLVVMDAAKTIDLTTFATNPASTRTHKVWLCVFDKLVAGTEYNAKIIVTEDTNGTGAAPPTGYAAILQLATISMSSGQTTILNAQISNIINIAWTGATVGGAIAINAAYADASGVYDTMPVAAIHRGGRIYLSGALKRASGTGPMSGTTVDPIGSGGAGSSGPTVNMAIGTMTSVFRPKHLVDLTGTTNEAPYTWRLQISSSGVMLGFIPASSDPTLCWFDGMSYEINI